MHIARLRKCIAGIRRKRSISTPDQNLSKTDQSRGGEYE